MHLLQGGRGKVIEYGYFTDPVSGLMSVRVKYALQTLVKHPRTGQTLNMHASEHEVSFPLEKLDKVGLGLDDNEIDIFNMAINNLFEAKFLGEQFLKMIQNLNDFEIDTDMPEIKSKFLSKEKDD